MSFASSFRCLIVVVALLPLVGCATVAGGARDKKITITSEPPGAAIVVDGQPFGATPAIVKLSRKSDHQVAIHMTGYEPAALTIHQRFNPWFAGNLLIGGLVGMVIDLCTGATYTLSPDEVVVKLRPEPSVPAPPLIPSGTQK